MPEPGELEERFAIVLYQDGAGGSGWAARPVPNPLSGGRGTSPRVCRGAFQRLTSQTLDSLQSPFSARTEFLGPSQPGLASL
ncbi:hypothetical protein TREES_T100017278 [Tupaia chinensis]|uniref:Uncharacterized protein n=1 Tax=Tupaia chinensis TaxID=246437 RepID=L9JF76_TUPCH|nr:hypothetical protein TREES_T100017278 [Tupaia chinensis]